MCTSENTTSASNDGPVQRPRRLRRGSMLRNAVADVTLTPDDFVMPIFVRIGEGLNKPISSMPGVSQMSPDIAVSRIDQLSKAGLKQFILFGVIDAKDKDAVGSAAMDPENPVNVTLKRVKDAGIDALMYADLCFCEYTDHGHCGALCSDMHMTVDNDTTLRMLGEQAVVLSNAGADIVAPSGMMDGMVSAIRNGLDHGGYQDIAIMSYSIKYASGFYGPFREAGEGAPSFGDRRGYQMDYRRSQEWRIELQHDLHEGADMVMIKPAMAYLDVIRQVRDATSVPVGAYHVSGEYSMLHAAADRGLLDLKTAALEVNYGLKRAGADLIFSYFAPKMLEWL